MLRYLSRAEIASERAIQWGILTNGRYWRLYYQGARSRSEEFFELDLALIAKAPTVDADLFSPAEGHFGHFLKVFYLLFRREAFLRTIDGTQTFHGFAINEARQWEAKVAESLSEVVFETIFPKLLNALVHCDRHAPKPLNGRYWRKCAAPRSRLLYRPLFILYAEDRRLLPTKERRYDDYALTRIRGDIRKRNHSGDAFSKSQSRLSW